MRLSTLLILLCVLCSCGTDRAPSKTPDKCYQEHASTGMTEVSCGPEDTGSTGQRVTSCTLPAPASVVPTVLTYRPGLTLDHYAAASPVGSWVLVGHGGGGTSTSASKRDANVVTLCQMLVAEGIDCFAYDYTVATSTSPTLAGFLDTSCAIRFVHASAAGLGLDPARGGVAGISWGGTLVSWAAYSLRAGYTVPGGAGSTLPLGTDATDATCPTAPAVGDDSMVHAVSPWYSPVDVRTWQGLNTNGAAANHSLEIDFGASFGTPLYTSRSGDASALLYPHSFAATGITLSFAQGQLTVPAGVDGDGFVKRTTQCSAFAGSNCIAATGFGHNFSPGATGAALAANCSNFSVLESL